MRKKKTIKKPVFIKIFLIRLAIFWVITALLGAYLYVLTDIKAKRHKEELENTYIRTLQEECEKYYDAYRYCDTFGYTSEYKWNLEKARQHLLLEMQMAAQRTGIYAELHVDDQVVTPPEYINGMNAFLIWRQGMSTDYSTIMSCDVSLPDLSFSCEGEGRSFDANDRISSADLKVLNELDRVQSVDNDLGYPFWHFQEIAYDPDDIQGYPYKLCPITDIYVDYDDLKFIPVTFAFSGDDETGEYIRETWELTDEIPTTGDASDGGYMFFSDYLLSDSREVGKSTMVVFYEPENMLTAADVSRITDGTRTLRIEDMNKSEDDEDITFDEWTLWIATPEYESFFECAPRVVVLNFIFWFLLAGVLALVISYIKYVRRKSVYEIVEYRKNVTNNMAHDLKTPLAAISAYAENLEENINSDKRSYYSAKIRENTQAMNHMIESILDFSKSETGAVKIVMKEVAIKGVVENEIEKISELFKKNDIKITVKGNDVKVKTDENLMRQALRNLIGNAAKFAREGSMVDISIDAKELSITDLTDEKIADLKHIKDPFVKGASERGSVEGTGLGLAIAESSLEACGHKLEISMEGDMFKAVIKF